MSAPVRAKRGASGACCIYCDQGEFRSAREPRLKSSTERQTQKDDRTEDAALMLEFHCKRYIAALRGAFRLPRYCHPQGGRVAQHIAPAPRC